MCALVNAQLEEYAAANGSLSQEATKEMAKNLIMRQLEEHTFTSADAGRGVMSAADEIAVMKAVLEQYVRYRARSVRCWPTRRSRTSTSVGPNPWW